MSVLRDGGNTTLPFECELARLGLWPPSWLTRTWCRWPWRLVLIHDLSDMDSRLVKDSRANFKKKNFSSVQQCDILYPAGTIHSHRCFSYVTWWDLWLVTVIRTLTVSRWASMHLELTLPKSRPFLPPFSCQFLILFHPASCLPPTFSSAHCEMCLKYLRYLSKCT